MYHRFAALGVLAFALTPDLLVAQQRAAAVPTMRLDRPEAEFAEPFSQISGVRELSDGRVVVTDTREKAVRILDFRRGTLTPMGREGNGPNEYAQPMGAWALPGDSTAVFDMPNMRFITFAPNGQPARTWTANSSDSPTGRVMGAPRGTDERGRLYFQGRPVVFGPNGPEAADSTAILRFDPRSERLDTVAFIRQPRADVRGSQAPGGGNRVSVMIGAEPFQASDDWAVGLDGRIALVRSADYRVEWLAPGGQRVAGRPIPFTPVRVTELDKEQFRESRRNPQVSGTVVRMGPGGASSGPAPTPMTFSEPTSWPDVKPPFMAGPGIGAQVGPDGRLWVQRYRAANDPNPRYDLIDSFGNVVGHAVLPPRSRLVGFGRGTAYVVRTDDDDLQYLQRFRLF